MCLKEEKLKSQEILSSILFHLSVSVHFPSETQNDPKGQLQLLLGEGLLSRHMKL